MIRWRQIAARVIAPLRRAQFESDLEAEIEFHIEQQSAEFIHQGMPPDEARRIALREFGGAEQIREQVRDAAGQSWLVGLVQDLRFALQIPRRSPVFALVLVLLLGLPIGLSTTIFSFVRAILIQPLPYPAPERLVVIRTVNPGRNANSYGASGPDFLDWKRQTKSFEAMAACHWTTFDLAAGRSSERLEGLTVSRDFFDVIGVPPALGRTFTENEEQSRAPSLVISRDVWRRRFDADPDILGKGVDVYSWSKLPEIGASRWEIVGVTGHEVPFPPTAVGLSGQSTRIEDAVQFWRPLTLDEESHRDWRDLFTVVARLKPGVTVDEANSEMRVISQQLADEYPDTNRGWIAEVVSFDDLVTATVRPALLLVGGAIALVLLIACANAASLLLVRGIARQQEMAVRMSLGAGRTRLVRQLVTESVLLCFVSGTLGTIVATWGVGLLRRLAPADVPRLGDVRVDALVLAFALGLSLATGVVVGMVPALFASRTNVHEALKSGGRGASMTRARRRLVGALVVVEGAVCVVLLTGAAMLLQSFVAVTAVDPGFRADHLLAMTVSLPQAKYEWAHNAEFCAAVVEKLRATPGVESAAAVRGLPLRETRIDVPLFLEGRPNVPSVERPTARIRVVTPMYFETMQIPLLEGRSFEPGDLVGEVGYTRVVLCNETMARRFWPGESALGKRFSVVTEEYALMEVVGVVGDVRYTKLAEPPVAEIYYPDTLFPQAEFTLVARTRTDPIELLPVMERIVRDVEPDAIITDQHTMAELVSESLSHERFLMLLVTAFSIGALILAITGHYGVVAYSVSQRRKEIGIRMALGATPGGVAWMIVAEGLLLSAAALVVGAAASLACRRVLASELYNVPDFDYAPLAGAATVLMVASTLASLVPSLRGARTHPADVLRAD